MEMGRNISDDYTRQCFRKTADEMSLTNEILSNREVKK
jgi:hypothetical protein